MLDSAAGLFVGTLFPERCFGCRKIASDCLCGSCRAEIAEVLPPVCPLCGAPGREGLCPGCSDERRYFDSARSAYVYEGALRTAVLAFKFGGYRRLARPLAEGIVPLAQKLVLEGSEGIVALPSEPLREWRRGFNPPGLLAAECARSLDLPLLDGVLGRRWGGKAQVGSGIEQRRENVSGRFYVSEPARLQECNLILVDDVFTTGATCSEAARVMKAAGAEEVHVITVARD